MACAQPFGLDAELDHTFYLGIQPYQRLYPRTGHFPRIDEYDESTDGCVTRDKRGYDFANTFCFVRLFF